MSSEKRKKNNEARMKVYSKNKEKEGWNQYEHHIVEHHHTKHKHTAWHWSRIPEEHLYHAGYINEFNKHRLERLAKFKEGTNPHKDYGLDGLSMDSDKTYHGLQAKYFLTNKVSANDIGTFQSVTRRLNKKNPLSKGYLYTSSSLEATLAEDIKCIGDIIHEKVLFEPEDKRTTRHQKKVVEEINLPLRQYQKDALESLKEEREGIATLSLFCGGGKTLIAGHYLSELKPKIIVMIAPLKISVDNLYQRMESFFNGYEHLVIDSDSGNTTDADLVKEKLDLDKPIVLYTTFASAVNVLSKIFDEDEELFEDSFCLVDECHNIVNNTELCEFISRFYDGLLMSATIPEELYEVIECEPVYEYGMAEAIKEGYCVNYNVWLPLVVKKEESNSIEIDIPEEFEKSDLCAKVLFLVNGMLQTGSKRCIIYLRNTDECAAFNKLFTKVCKEYHGLSSWTETIDCDVKQEKRRTILEDFQSEKEDLTTLHILASLRILDEAVDVVRCDSEFITYVGENADDKRAVQRLQRGGRLDSMNSSKRNNLFIWCSEYASMLSMLSLLKESDPEFHTKLRILNGSYDEVGKKESVEKSAIQLGDLQKYVEVKCLSINEKYIQRVNEIKEFYEKYKVKPNQRGIIANENILGRWLNMVRVYNKKKKLHINIINYINNNLPWFHWNQHIEVINNIKIFYEKYQYEPKFSGKLYNEKKYSLYLRQRRNEKRKGRLDINIEKQMIEKLPWLEWDISFKHRHIKKIKLIKEFYEKYKREPKSTAKEQPEKSLAIYIMSRRKDKKNGKLTLELEKQIIDNLPWFCWDPFNEHHIKMIKLLKEFYEKYKQLPFRYNNRENEKELCKYLDHRRSDKKNNTLSLSIQNEIESIIPDFIWDPINGATLRNILKLEEFYKKFNREPKTNGPENNENTLSQFMTKLRRLINNNELTNEEYAAFKKLLWFRYNVFDEHHMHKIKEIKEFYEKYKREPKSTAKEQPEKSLAIYIMSRRKDKKNGKLTLELEKQIIEDLPWFRWSPFIEEHIKMIKLLKEFYEKYNKKPTYYIKNSIDENSLSMWIGSRKKNKKNGKLDKELEDLIKEECPWLEL